MFVLWNSPPCYVCTSMYVLLCVLWRRSRIIGIDNKQPATPRCTSLCDSHLLPSGCGWTTWRMLFFILSRFSRSLSDSLSFAHSFTPAHCIFPSLGSDKGKWGSPPPYAPPRFKLTSALIARRDCTVEQEITFFIGCLLTLLWLLMSKRPRSTSSRFNLTEWGVREYVITAAQAPLFAVTVLSSFQPHGSLAFDLSAGRALIIMQQ